MDWQNAKETRRAPMFRAPLFEARLSENRPASCTDGTDAFATHEAKKQY